MVRAEEKAILCNALAIGVVWRAVRVCSQNMEQNGLLEFNHSC